MAQVVPTNIDIQMQFSGSAGAWTSVRTDVSNAAGIRCAYGIDGTGPQDRVAGTGTLSFALNNAQNNSAKLIGYYSPGHANARSGFEIGIGVRFAVTYSGSTFYKFVGKLDEIAPLPGAYRQRFTHCLAVDWMDEAAVWKLNNIATQIGQRPDQIVQTIYQNMTLQPAAASLNAGGIEFPFALDTARDESTTALQEFQRVAQSDLGWVFIKGDASTGGVLTYQDWRYRLNPGPNVYTFSNDMREMQATRARARVYNRIRSVLHPRIVDAAATAVLYALDAFNKPSIQSGCALTLIGQYTDPAQRAQRVGGTCMVTPVSGTDYTFGTDPNGANLNADLSVSASFGANTAFFNLSNTSGCQTGFVSLLQARGVGLYDYNETALEFNDQASQDAYGEHLAQLNMPYQSSINFGRSSGSYLLSQWKNPLYTVDRIQFNGNSSSALLVAGLQGEPGGRCTLTESVTGISASQFFIQGVEIHAYQDDLIDFTWVVVPRTDLTDYWVLNVDKLGQTAADTGAAYSVLGP